MITLYDFQSNAVERLLPRIKEQKSALLIGATGTGKTYIFGRILEYMFNEGLINKNVPFPVFYLTKASVVPQSQEVLFGEFKLSPRRIFVSNYDQLRAQLGNLFLSWQEKYNSSLTDKWLEPYWKPEYMPQCIIADECQALKNEDTLQSKILLQYVKQGGMVIAGSATPFTRVSEGRFVTLAIKPQVQGFGTIKDFNWQHFSNVVAGSRSSPTDWNNEAVKRLTDQLEDGIVRLKGVKFQKRTLTHCKLIDFANEDDRENYNRAYEDYLEELAKINKDEPGGVAKIWTAQTKFRIRAETIRAPYLAKIAKDVVETLDKQVIIGSNYVNPLNIIKSNLIKLGVKEDEIAIIVGGQSREDRQENIRRYQTGQAKYCLFTLKSGGVGLSLHHYEKNRHTCKPRYVILPATWSAIELVQALGRAHRINSISTTYQDIVWFRETIEEYVAEKLSKKLHCLAEIVSKKEVWSDLFSRRSDLANIEELKQLSIKESCDTEENDEHQTEEFCVEAYQNPTSEDEIKEIELEIVK